MHDCWSSVAVTVSGRTLGSITWAGVAEMLGGKALEEDEVRPQYLRSLDVMKLS